MIESAVAGLVTERSAGRTEVVVDEGMNTVSYELNEALIAFSTAIEEGDLQGACEMLERLELTGEGPVTADLDAGDGAAAPGAQQFVFLGPGTLVATDRGGTISFQNEARGRGLTDRTGAAVLLSGSVRAVSVEGELESESVLATYDEGRGVKLAAEGPSTVSARRGSGHVR